MSGDYRDLVIAELATSEAELREKVQAYRALALVAIERIADLTRERDRLREQLTRLRDEFRFVREQLLWEREAA